MRNKYYYHEMQSLIGSHIGNYRLTKLLGSGGMGNVFEAIDDRIRRRVAVKLLRTDYSDDARALQRFFDEARAANECAHSGIVQITDCGQAEDGTAFLVMELLDGETLREFIERHPGLIAEQVATRIGVQLASALAAAHQKHIVHRDIKPSNVMVVRDPLVPGDLRTKLLDFGIAKLCNDTRSNTGNGSASTRAGTVLGTPLYMSPEQCLDSSRATDKSDVYSLGVVLYELLTGRPPFRATENVQFLHVYQPPSPLRELAAQTTPATAALVDRMLAKQPDDRPTMPLVYQALSQSAKVLNESAQPIHRRVPIEPRWAKRNGVAGALLIVLGTGVLLGVAWLSFRTVTTPVPPLDQATERVGPPVVSAVDAAPIAVPNLDQAQPLQVSDGKDPTMPPKDSGSTTPKPQKNDKHGPRAQSKATAPAPSSAQARPAGPSEIFIN